MNFLTVVVMCEQGVKTDLRNFFWPTEFGTFLLVGPNRWHGWIQRIIKVQKYSCTAFSL